MSRAPLGAAAQLAAPTSPRARGARVHVRRRGVQGTYLILLLHTLVRVCTFANSVLVSFNVFCIRGPAARKFFRECLALADDDRDIDLYHWSSTRFSAVWRDTLSVLVARGRAQVSVAAAVADWPKRIRDMRYVDHEDYDGTD